MKNPIKSINRLIDLAEESASDRLAANFYKRGTSKHVDREIKLAQQDRQLAKDFRRALELGAVEVKEVAK